MTTDIVLKVRPPQEPEVKLLTEGSTLISFLYPGQNQALVKQLAEQRVNAFGKWI